MKDLRRFLVCEVVVDAKEGGLGVVMAVEMVVVAMEVESEEVED